MDLGRVPVDCGHKRVLVLPAEPAPAGTGMVPAASVASVLAVLAASVPAVEHEVAMIFRLEKQIKPLSQIAQNMGFQGNWIYEN